MRSIVLLAAVPAAILLSCNREHELVESVVLPEGEAGTASGQLISFSTGEETRGPFAIDLFSFGVFAVGSSTGNEIMYDQMVRKAMGGYTYSPPKYFPDEGIDIMAYAPYGCSSVSFPDGAALPTTLEFSLPESLSDDVLLAGPLRRIHSSPVMLLFQHPLTSISVSFSFSPLSVDIPSGKGARITSLSLSHCIREGTYDVLEDSWTSKGELCPASREVSVIARGSEEVTAVSFYSVPFTAPPGATLHIGWEAFNLDSGAATRRFSVDVDLSGRDFALSHNTTAKARVLWYNDTIVFEDEEAERVCVAAFDTDGDGALSYVEAESVTDLGDVFRGNDRIVSFNEFVYFTGVETLPGFLRGPFDYMSSLKEITLPPSLRDVGGWPFATCHSLENIFVDPANLRYYSVDGCLYSRPDRTLVRVPEVTSFDTFEIPSGITTIGYGCFEANSTIKELRIGRDVTSIAGEALKIYSLEKVSVDPASTSFKVIDEALYALENGAPVALRLLPSRCGVTSLVLPSSVRTIGGYAICDIPDFHSITLNEGLESIQQYAFNSVSFDHLVIPSTVTFLNDCCLRFVALSSLTVLSELPPSLGSHVFPFEGEEVYSAYPVFVPAASMPLYLSAPGWSALSSRITPLP